MNNDAQVLPGWRRGLFIAAFVAALLAAIGTTGCWMDPFPLIAFSSGGYGTNPLDEYAFFASVGASLLTIILGAFGSGSFRVILILIGCVLLALSAFGFVSNHV